MAYCHNCGDKVEREDARFCPSCGSKLSRKIPEVIPLKTEKRDMPYESQQPPPPPTPPPAPQAPTQINQPARQSIQPGQPPPGHQPFTPEGVPRRTIPSPPPSGLEFLNKRTLLIAFLILLAIAVAGVFVYFLGMGLGLINEGGSAGVSPAQNTTQADSAISQTIVNSINSNSVLKNNYMQARSTGMLTACRSNLKNVGTALEMYATDNIGRYPPSLSYLTTDYLKQLPTCPAAGYDTYSGGYMSRITPDSYVVYCSGHNHGDVGEPPNLPAYSSRQGLVDRDFESLIQEFQR